LNQLVSPYTALFAALALHPYVQKRAQQAIDEVMRGLGRLPDFTEHRKIPYIDALVRELLRWRPVTPVGASRLLLGPQA